MGSGVMVCYLLFWTLREVIFGLVAKQWGRLLAGFLHGATLMPDALSRR